MKQIKYIPIVVFILCLLSACENENSYSCEPETIKELNNKEVRFTLASVSYATQTGTFEKGDAIGVFATYHNNINSLIGENVKYTYNGTHFESDNPILFKAKPLDFYTYYPYDANNSNIHSIEYNIIDQQNVSAWQASDFLTAVNAVGIDVGDIPLQFFHKYATVQFGVEEIPNLTGCVMQNVKTHTTLDFSSNVAVTGSQMSNINMIDRGVSNGVRTYEATVPTQDLGNTVFVVTKSTGSDIRCQLSGNTTLQEGRINHFGVGLIKTITIGEFKPYMGSVTGGGKYNFETNCDLVAKPVEPGYHFSGWFESGTKVYDDTNYSFTVFTDRTLTPLFENDTTWTDWNLTLTTSTTSLGRDGGSATITTNCTREVYVKGVHLKTETSPPVLSINHPSFSLTGNVVSVGGNPINSGARTCVVTATTAEGVTKSVSITQAKGIVETYTYTYEFSVSPSSYTFGKDGGSYTFSVSCNYVVRQYHDGVLKSTNSNPYYGYSTSVSGSGFSRSGNTVYASANSGSARSGTFTVSAGSNSASVALYQERGITITTSTGYEISISPNSYQFGENGGSYTFTVTCNYCTYTYHDGVLYSTDRVTYSGYSRSVTGSGFSYSGNTVTATANTGKDRTGTFTVSAGGKSASASLSQIGKVEIGTGIQ